MMTTTRFEVAGGDGSQSGVLKEVTVVTPQRSADFDAFDRQMKEISEAFKNHEGEVSGMDISRKLQELREANANRNPSLTPAKSG